MSIIGLDNCALLWQRTLLEQKDNSLSVNVRYHCRPAMALIVTASNNWFAKPLNNNNFFYLPQKYVRSWYSFFPTCHKMTIRKIRFSLPSLVKFAKL